VNRHSLASVCPDTASDTVRATEVDGTVLKVTCDALAASLKTPLRLMEKSASRSSRSIADLSTPVTSCTPRGVANWKAVTSFLMAFGVPLESSTDSVVHPRPDSLLVVLTSLGR